MGRGKGDSSADAEPEDEWEEEEEEEEEEGEERGVEMLHQEGGGRSTSSSGWSTSMAAE